MIYSLFIFLSIILLLGVSSAYDISPEGLADEVVSLPGLSTPLPFRSFSGYLQINENKFIHYWFFESQSQADKAPVAMWTNGGPGCSGLIGLFEEHGPIRANSDGTLSQTLERSWNRLANVFYVEVPVGVGFSFSNDPADYTIGDAQTADDNYHVILEFFKKFPGLKNNKLIITSESYGGHYMPTLAQSILSYNSKAAASDRLNFYGLFVGNPYTNLDENFIGTYETFCGRSLVPLPICTRIHKHCYPSTNNQECASATAAASALIATDVDPYALDFPVCNGRLQQRRLIQSLPLYRNNQKLMQIKLKQYDPCESNYEQQYLNRPDVQAALHVKAQNSWLSCSNIVNYNNSDSSVAMDPIYPQLIKQTNATLKITVYSGDDDSVCGTLGTQSWVYGLGLTEVAPWAPWFLNGQLAGYITKFQGLNFLTVHTAGHEVPAMQPERAFLAWTNFINDSF